MLTLAALALVAAGLAPATIEGLVRTDAEAPVAASIEVRKAGEDALAVQARTDGDGRFAMPVAPGIWDLEVQATDCWVEPIEGVVLDAGARISLAVRCRTRGGSVRGSVLDEHGKPAPGAAIAGFWQSMHEGGPCCRAHADSRGRFFLSASILLMTELAARKGQSFGLMGRPSCVTQRLPFEEKCEVDIELGESSDRAEQIFTWNRRTRHTVAGGRTLRVRVAGLEVPPAWTEVRFAPRNAPPRRTHAVADIWVRGKCLDCVPTELDWQTLRFPGAAFELRDLPADAIELRLVTSDGHKAAGLAAADQSEVQLDASSPK
jgi:hypothetical protein